jgi:hypothetical protein
MQLLCQKLLFKKMRSTKINIAKTYIFNTFNLLKRSKNQRTKTGLYKPKINEMALKTTRI